MDVTKILILASNPFKDAVLGVDEEYREINEVLKKSKHREKFKLEFAPASREQDLRQLLLEYEPQIVHFSGHGESDGLYFQDDQKKAKLIKKEALTRLFGLYANQIKCVFLNACYTQEQSESIAQHIDYVIGMSKEIGDDAAIKFATGFYEALFSGKEIQFAYNSGCVAIDLADIPESQTPQLIKRKPQVHRPFLPHKKYDVLIHASISDKNWAQLFMNELKKYLVQKLNNQTCSLHLETDDNVHFEEVALSLLIISNDYINEYKDIFSKIIRPEQKQFAIFRTNACPKDLAGLSKYNFQSPQSDHFDIAQLEELSSNIVCALNYLRKEFEFSKLTKPFNEPLVFIHHEPKTEEYELAKSIKPKFKASGLACTISNLNSYKDDVRLNQKNCNGVLLLWGSDYSWARDRLHEYYSKQQNRKAPLKIVVVHADCSRESKDIDSLDIYNSVPVLPCPPKNVDEIVQHFEAALK